MSWSDLPQQVSHKALLVLLGSGNADAIKAEGGKSHGLSKSDLDLNHVQTAPTLVMDTYWW